VSPASYHCHGLATKMVYHRAVTVQSLPNEVLLYIFSFHRLLSGGGSRPPSAAWRWHTLAHVCQRWRDIIFSSLRHLETRLIIPRKSPKTPLDSCTALPLSIRVGNGRISEEQRANVIAAFKHPNRICEIHLSTTMGFLFRTTNPSLSWNTSRFQVSRVSIHPTRWILEWVHSQPPLATQYSLELLPPSCVTPTSFIQPGSRLSSPWLLHPHT